MRGNPKLYEILENLNIEYGYMEHPEAPTIEIARQYWDNDKAVHCKNIFFRNHKGNKHYLVIIEHQQRLDIADLEKRLKQGKLTFASEKRLDKYLGVKPGSVTPYGLINDTEKHVVVFIDENLANVDRISFHPCVNTASISTSWNDFIKFLNHCGNTYHLLKLYD